MVGLCLAVVYLVCTAAAAATAGERREEVEAKYNVLAAPADAAVAAEAKEKCSACAAEYPVEIEEEEYILTLRTLAQKKYRTLKKEQYLRRKYKVKDHLIRKGYEPELVKKVLQEITESND